MQTLIHQFYECEIIGRSKDVASADGRHISVIIILSLELCVMSCRSLGARVKNIPFDQFFNFVSS